MLCRFENVTIEWQSTMGGRMRHALWPINYQTIMNRLLIHTFTLTCALAVGVTSADAKGNGKDKSKGKPASHAKGKPDHAGNKNKHQGGKGNAHSKSGTNWKFADVERNDVIRFWDGYKGHPHGLPPGLAKNVRRGKPLPPGWQKKLTPGWIVTDDWWNRFTPVPTQYLPKGFHVPRDTGMFLLDDIMVSIHIPTRRVIDTIGIPSIKW